MGNIVFEKSTNQRKFVGYNIYQFRFVEDWLDFRVNYVGDYSILSSTFFSLADVEWYEDEVPSDIRPLYKN